MKVLDEEVGIKTTNNLIMELGTHVERACDNINLDEDGKDERRGVEGVDNDQKKKKRGGAGGELAGKCATVPLGGDKGGQGGDIESGKRNSRIGQRRRERKGRK